MNLIKNIKFGALQKFDGSIEESRVNLQIVEKGVAHGPEDLKTGKHLRAHELESYLQNIDNNKYREVTTFELGKIAAQICRGICSEEDKKTFTVEIAKRAKEGATVYGASTFWINRALNLLNLEN